MSGRRAGQSICEAAQREQDWLTKAPMARVQASAAPAGLHLLGTLPQARFRSALPVWLAILRVPPPAHCCHHALVQLPASGHAPPSPGEQSKLRCPAPPGPGLTRLGVQCAPCSCCSRSIWSKMGITCGWLLTGGVGSCPATAVRHGHHTRAGNSQGPSGPTLPGRGRAVHAAAGARRVLPGTALARRSVAGHAGHGKAGSAGPAVLSGRGRGEPARKAAGSVSPLTQSSNLQ